MCTEFILSLIYLSIILVINYLLFKLLISYQSNVLSLIKIKNIFSIFNKDKLSIVYFLYENSKKEQKKLFFLNEIKNFSKTQDILIIGNVYKYISNFEKSKKKSNVFYFKLLEQQFLNEN